MLTIAYLSLHCVVSLVHSAIWPVHVAYMQLAQAYALQKPFDKFNC